VRGAGGLHRCGARAWDIGRRDGDGAVQRRVALRRSCDDVGAARAPVPASPAVVTHGAMPAL
jgi:hypothetical protein